MKIDDKYCKNTINSVLVSYCIGLIIYLYWFSYIYVNKSSTNYRIISIKAEQNDECIYNIVFIYYIIGQILIVKLILIANLILSV